jgi:hypothetical protein
VGNLARVIVAAAAMLAHPANAHQPAADSGAKAVPRTPERDKEANLTFFAAFGWGGIAAAGRLSPIRIELSPSDEALAGTVTIEHRQDALQSAAITVPFAATPGKPTRVEAITALPMSQEAVRITVRGAAPGRPDRVLAMQTLSAAGQRLPRVVQSIPGLLVGVGRTSAVEGLTAWSAAFAAAARGSPYGGWDPRLNPSAAEVSRRLAFMYRPRIREDELPTAWAAFDGVALLVVNGDSADLADPRSLDAIQTWVVRGGKLAIVASGPGDSWRRWLPESGGGPAAPVDLVEPAELAPPPALGEILLEFERTPRARNPENPGEEAGAAPTVEPLPGLAATLPGRAMRLRAAAGGAGWTGRWEAPGGGVLLAEGPIGLGWVVVLGFDPARATEIASSRAAGAIWRAALDAPFRTMVRWNPEAYGYGSIGPDPALSTAVEHIALVPMVGAGIFVGIAACMLVLALLVGPGDYLVLRRLRAAHWSWLTALGWVGAACAGAYIVPRAIRTDPTSVGRLSIVDALASGGPVSTPVLTAATGITGIYAAQSGTVAVSGIEPGSWWRGAAPEMGFGVSQHAGGGIVPILQAAAGGDLGSRRAAPLARLPLAIWTFRSFMDLGAPELPLAATLNRVGSDYSITVAGLPPESRVIAAAVRVPVEGAPQASLWIEAAGSTPPQRRSVSGVMEEPSVLLAPQAPVGRQEGGAWTAEFPRASAGAAAASGWTWAQSFDPLPGVAERTQAIEALVASGRWAMVGLVVDNWPAEPVLSWSARYRHTRILRLLIPLEEPR